MEDYIIYLSGELGTVKALYNALEAKSFSRFSTSLAPWGGVNMVVGFFILFFYWWKNLKIFGVVFI